MLCYLSYRGEGSDIRKRADQVLNHIIKPATENSGYNAIRADAISEPGILTTQVIQHLIDDDLVVADLTGRNPNVFYELAIRHAIRKPIVQIIDVDEPIPFDVAQQRTILVDLHDLDSVANCRSELCNQIQIVEEDPTKVDSPVSMTVDLLTLKHSKNPLEKSTTEIVSMLQELGSAINELRTRAPMGTTAGAKVSPEIISDLHKCLSTLRKLDLEKGKPVTQRVVDIVTASIMVLESICSYMEQRYVSPEKFTKSLDHWRDFLSQQ